jgi:WD40 repeat protein
MLPRPPPQRPPPPPPAPSPPLALPVELLVRVLRCLAAEPASLARAEAVCREWRAAARAAWASSPALLGGNSKDAYAAAACARRWAAAPAAARVTLRGHTRAVRAVALQYDAAVGATLFASGSDDATVRLWRAPPAPSGGGAWACEGVLRHGAPVSALCFASPPGSAAALVAAAGSAAFLWRARACVRRFDARAPPPLTALAASDGELFAAVAADASVRVFDLLSGAMTRLLRLEGGSPARALALHAPARLLATAGFDGLRVVDAAGGRPLPWRLGGAPATAVALRPSDGALAYVGHADGSLSCTDLRTGRDVAAAALRLHARATVALHAPHGAPVRMAVFALKCVAFVSHSQCGVTMRVCFLFVFCVCADMPDGCLLVAGGVDGVALLTPAGKEAGAPPAVRHLCGGRAAAQDDGGGGGGEISDTRGTAAAAPSACGAHGSGGGSGAARWPRARGDGGGSGGVEGGSLLCAAANQAWVITGHGDGAARLWRLGAAPPPMQQQQQPAADAS